jgi:hypothetical protein
MFPRLYPLDVSPAVTPAHEADESPVPVPPDESMPSRLLLRRAAYDRHYTSDLWPRAAAQARRHLGVRSGPDEALDLVQGVIEDTLNCRLAWDPDRKPLVDHVCDQVHSRARHAREHARRFRHVSLPSVDDSSDQVGIVGALSAMRTAVSEIEEKEDRAERARLLETLRGLVAGDEAALAILGSSGEPDVTLRAASGLSGWEYENAMGKLRRLARQLRGSSARTSARAGASPSDALADRATPKSGAGYRGQPRPPRAAKRGRR